VPFGAAVLVALAPGCSRAPTRQTSEPANAPTATSTTNPVPADDVALRIGGVNGYVGSLTCKECHARHYASWRRTYHRTMTQLPTPAAVQADFSDAVLTNAGVRFVLSRTNRQFQVHMEWINPSSPGHPAHEAVDVPVGLVTGSHHMQVFWVANGMGNCQVGFPFTWLIPERRWVPRNMTFLRPPSLGHESETWNFVCARCHTTAPQPNLDPATLTWHTHVEELGIACEACHGPGARHVARQRRLQHQPTQPAPARKNLLIVNPDDLSPIRAAQICGFCHSMKWWNSRERWPVRPFRYRPGDDLEATTPIIRPHHLDQQPWLKDVLAQNPNLLRDFFWPDGMIRVSGRDYNGLIESPCYRGGQFSCLSCHSMHHSDPDAQLARNRGGNLACTQCHSAFRTPAQVTAHTHHAAGSSGSLCYNCHMPRTTYGVLKAIRSHQISSPKIADELATGRPNACNLCHLDKTLAWTTQQLARWYHLPAPRLSTNQAAVADAVRLALSGDAGQRVLMAWHLGWKPGWEAAGTDWMPPVLATLLDDPYAAVRCMAARSFRKLAPRLLPPGYDYTIPPETRPAVEPLVLRRWGEEQPGRGGQGLPAQTLVRRDDLQGTQQRFEQVGRHRDDRPIRLRE
jgi:predicted CXXCH cytochrome family protein